MQDDSARIREQWQPVIQAIIAAADWGGKYATEVEPFLAQMEQEAVWRPLCAAFRRIIAGERTHDTLLNGLDRMGAIVVTDVLVALGVDVPAPDGEDQDLLPIVEQIIERVAFVCQDGTPVVYGEEMYEITQKMMEHPRLDPELREVGRVLHAILAGERKPDLTPLSPPWAMQIRALLRQIGS